MKPLALRWRLSLLTALVLSVGVCVNYLFIYNDISELLFREMDRSLLVLARAAEEAATDTTDTSVLSARLAGLFPTGRHARTVVRIWNEGSGQVVFDVSAPNTEWDKILPTLTRPAAGQHLFFSRSIAGRNYRGVWLGPAQNRSSVAVAQPTGAVESELRELRGDFLWMGVVGAAAMIALVLLVVHVGLRPLHFTADRLRNINAGNLAEAGLEPQRLPSELAPFADSLRQMLRRLNDSIQRQRTFVADASHELRTPVAAAKSTVQATLAGPRSAAEYREALEESLEDLRRMEHLLDELLLLARLDGAAAAPPDEQVELDQLLTELADSLDAKMAQAGGKLVRSLAPARIRGDHGQLTRLFSNLLDNALRHGPKGGTIHLTVETGPGRVVVTVKDEGGNIPPDAVAHLFERFFRVDGSRTSATGGTGLGLAIAHEITVRHGGTIRITSEPAAGTQVIVTLPLSPNEDTK